jgi:nitric oxide reductase NorD protein
MAEPEDVILDGAHAATTAVARLWRRNAAGPPRVLLSEVRQRLELLTGALFGDVRSIVASEPAAPPSFAARVARRIPRHLIDDREYAGTDGARIRLPRWLDASGGREGVVAEYRLFAVEQAARAARGTWAELPPQSEHEVHDLYLLCEAAEIDRWLASELPGLSAELRAARRRSLLGRPPIALFSPRERQVEELLRALLSAAAESPPAVLAAGPRPSDSLVRARELSACAAGLPGRYRGLPVVPLWGRTERRSEGKASWRQGEGHPEEPRLVPERIGRLRRSPKVRQAADDEDDDELGMWMIQLDDPQESVEDPMGLQRPADRDTETDADDLADSLADLPEARLVATPGAPTEVLTSDDPPSRSAVAPESTSRSRGIAYPEWDYRVSAYHVGKAIVRELTVPKGTTRWVQDVRRRHSQEIEQVRRRFERLRPQRIRLSRQLDGSDVDIEAWTTSHADMRAGRAGDDRLYESVRPVRRDIAISLLVDISGSTDSWLSDQRRIIDVEKEAVLLVCEALDALGDRWSVLGFSGEGASGVAVYPVKRFDDLYGESVRLRIAGLEHDRYTRMGAALRHAGAGLTRERARHRLLLLLTDGKPNDVDLYEGRYGIEDTRQAVAEARLEGLHPFCLTVDREAPAYLPRVFGPGNYAILRRADTLPQALVDVVRRLLHA